MVEGISEELLVTANDVPSSLILFTIMMRAIRSSEMLRSYKSHTASHLSLPRRYSLQRTFGSNLASNKKNKLRGPWSASELYRQSDRHLSTKFSANFCG
jgi:hypothetical protein